MAVVGAGWSGLAAAVRLADHGVHCTLYEAARVAGGRARRVEWMVRKDTREETLSLDNGQHIFVGGYRRTLALLRDVGLDPDDAFERRPLEWIATSGFTLRATAHRAPWHLALGVLRAKGLSIDERWALAAFLPRARRASWTVGASKTVVEMLQRWGQPASLVRKFWGPLCVAAMNTHEEAASAQVFLNVLRDSLGADARDADLLLPQVDLGSLLPDAALAHVTTRAAHPATIHIGTRVQNVGIDERGVLLATGTSIELVDAERFDAAVLAVPPTETARLLASLALHDRRYADAIDACERFTYQPIVTAYLLYRDAPRWPSRMIALDTAPHVEHYGQWAFDRSDRLAARTPASADAACGLVAVVISADGPHRALEQKALVDALAAQLASQLGMPRRPLDARLIVEKRATFACVPDAPRLDAATPSSRLVLAGDHVAPADPLAVYPATIEAAVLAGERAADVLLADA